MTTPRSARDAALHAPVDVLDRETLVRVLDGLRDLPQQPLPRRSPDAPADRPAAVPLPRRRRSGREAPSLG